MTKPLDVDGSTSVDDGVVLVGRDEEGTVVASKWLPGPVSVNQIQEDVHHFAEDTGLAVEVGGCAHLDELIPTHIGRRLPASHSRLMLEPQPGVVSEPMCEIVRPAIIRPRRLPR